MNRIRLVFPILGTLLFLNFAARAGDLVQFPTGNAAWTVETTYPTAATPSPSPEGTPGQKTPTGMKPQKIEITQVDNLKRILITWIDGKTSQRWTVPNLNVIFETLPRDENVVTPIPPGCFLEQLNEFNMPYDSFGFNWIKPQYLKEKDPISYLGKSCFHYKGAVPVPTVDPIHPTDGPASTDWEAWIESKTLLPVAINTGTSLCIFTFQTKPPVGPLVPPAKFKKEIDYYIAVMGYR